MKRAPGVAAMIAVDRASSRPLHRQVYDGYREAIVQGRLRRGDRLPSTRALAAELGISRLPVVEAFEQLLAEGYCESRVGAGTFVALALAQDPTARSSTAGRSARELPGGRRTTSRRTASHLLQTGPWLRGGGPFALGAVAIDRFPFPVWSRLVSRHGRRRDPALWYYGEANGFGPLREAIAAYVETARAVRCDPDRVLIVGGSQQALEIAARVLLDPGDAVWVEEPGYFGFHQVLLAREARLVPVPVDAEGIDVAAGLARQPVARAAFVTPSHQFPLGATMSASRRLRLLDWARRAGAWIVEDDYNSEYRYESAPVAALQRLDEDERVVYVGTFSKVLLPGLRLGYLVLPPDLVERFVAVRRAIDFSSPTFLQAVLADFIAEGHFARHLRRTRALYRERRSALVEALARELGGALEVHGGSAGLHLATTFVEDRDDVAVAERAFALGLRTPPLSQCYIGRTRRRGLVLGYGGVGVEAMPEAVRTLGRAFAAVPPRRRRRA